MTHSSNPRVVITGMGTLCPVGNNVEESFLNLRQGISGIGTVASWCEPKWADECMGVTVGGEVKNFVPEDFVEPKKDVRRMGRFIQLAMAASHEAWHMAGLPDRLPSELGDEAGCIIGVGMVGLEVLTQNYDQLVMKGPKRVSPFFIPGTISNLAPGHIAIRRNLRQDNWALVSACASGTNAIGEAYLRIKMGKAKLMVTGGAESVMHPLGISGFHAMHAVCASKNNDPTKASRPFDKNRDGFVMGEGAGILVLEELTHAQKRGAKILAEVVGYGSTCDANHITAPAPQGEGAQRAMRMALKDAKLSPEDVAYINAHGTSTAFNDQSETDAIKAVFGEYAHRVLISSTKSMTGHLLGAAGGIEAIFSTMAINQGVVPPTINLDTPDPGCDLDYVPNKARVATVDVAMSNSFGFGGSNGVLVFKKF
jgi:3-oxoacyl-[acyl-carrier-protein] synthase II